MQCFHEANEKSCAKHKSLILIMNCTYWCIISPTNGQEIALLKTDALGLDVCARLLRAWMRSHRTLSCGRIGARPYGRRLCGRGRGIPCSSPGGGTSKRRPSGELPFPSMTATLLEKSSKSESRCQAQRLSPSGERFCRAL